MNPVFDKVYAPPRFSEVLPHTETSEKKLLKLIFSPEGHRDDV